MRIISISLQNFKRFTDLTVKDIPETTKLVLLVGLNGCGKSSIFDAIWRWYRQRASFGWIQDTTYYRKSEAIPYNIDGAVQVVTAGNVAPARGSVYMRTAYRHEPDFSVTNISGMVPPTEHPRFNRTIEPDVSVSQNYQRLVYETMASVYDISNDPKTVGQLREELIGQVRTSMKNVFGDLLLCNVTDPLGGGAFFFEKGAARFHYKNLSGGEKAAFDLLLDLHIMKKHYTDAVYCVDEVETHLHTRVQGALLKEMATILPDQCQLWVTTHSLGALRAAQEMSRQKSGTVCVIDFDDADPDVPGTLVPSNLDRVTWDKLMSIALDDFSQQLAPRVVVMCEGSSVGDRRKDFDAEIYNRILGAGTPDVLFVSGGSSNQLATTSNAVRRALATIMPNSRVIALCDRDDKSQAEVAQFEQSGGLVLPKRNIESYLFADDVVEALVKREDQLLALPDARRIRAEALVNSMKRGNPSDDLKSAAGEIYTKLKALLGLQRCGNTADAFMRDTLAPLIAPPMPTYQELKDAIVDRLP